jgi:dTDP-4-amino-4,6-dideoxygalactose transaminase
MKEYSNSFTRILKEDSFIDGEVCKEFETTFSSYLNIDHAVGVGNGFDALVLSLRALGIGKGNSVAVPSHTFVATWLAVKAVGANPVGIDVDSCGQLDLDLLESHSNIDCVIVVHMHGSTCDMTRLSKWTKKNKILLLEDCAQACGLEFDQKKVGSFGDISAFSFYPTKNLFAIGDGGAVCSNNLDLINKVRSISRYGRIGNDKYRHTNEGVNSRLDSIQAGIILINLRYLDSWNHQRSKIAKRFEDKLDLKVPRLSFKNESIYHHFILFSSNRDELREKLNSKKVQTEIHYPNLAAFEMAGNKDSNFPNGQFFSSNGLSIPISQWQDEKTTQKIIEVINETYV